MIRPAGDEDIDAIMELENALFDNSMNERTLKHELACGRGWVFGEPVHGYVLTRSDAGLVDITRLAVAPFAQRKGVGKALLEKALEGAPDVILTVMKDNAPALALYRSHGFKVVAHRSGALILRRQVPPSAAE